MFIKSNFLACWKYKQKWNTKFEWSSRKKKLDNVFLEGEEVRGHVVCSISGQSVHHMTSSLNNELLCLTLQEKLIILSVIKNQVTIFLIIIFKNFSLFFFIYL